MCQSLNLSIAVLFVSLCFLFKCPFGIHQPPFLQIASSPSPSSTSSPPPVHQSTNHRLVFYRLFCYSLVHLRHIYCSISSSIDSSPYLLLTSHHQSTSALTPSPPPPSPSSVSCLPSSTYLFLSKAFDGC